MFSIRLYLRILCSVSLIVLTLGLGIAGILTGRACILGTACIGIALGLTGMLVRHLNACNRKIRLFLDSLADNESMQHFPEGVSNEEQRHLHAAFNRIYAWMTEQKRNEFERKLHQKEYESWKKLMRVLTHEIMNSITPIVSLSETLLSYFPPQGSSRQAQEVASPTIEKTIRGLKAIRNQGQNLMGFTESYRQFAGLKRPTLSHFSLTDLIQDIQVLCQEDLRQQHIAFSVDFSQSGLQVHADKKMLSQVLLNLLRNAMQALAEQPHKEIRLKACATGTRLFTTMTDNGPGIPSNLLEDIFIPFFTTKTNGTGIGLSLSRQIIRMHGGELSVTSQPYQATSFTISLPLK